MSQYHIRIAQDSDQQQLLRLCEIPVSGHISIALERAPNYFLGAAIQTEDPAVFVCVDQSQNPNIPIGVFSVGSRKVYVDGAIKPLRYYSDLRIHPQHQKGRLLYQIILFLKENQFIPQEAYAETVIFSKNIPMLSLVEKRNKQASPKKFPLAYTFYKNYISHLVSLHKPFTLSTPTQYEVRKACTADIPQMQAFFNQEAPKLQHYPVYDFSLLETPYYKELRIDDFFLAFQEQQLVGMLGCWDQKNIKQTRIVRYSPVLKIVRPILNAISRLQGGLLLPKEGAVVEHLTLVSILIQNQDTAIFSNLLNAVSKQYSTKKHAYFLCGLSEGSPLLKVFQKIRAKRAVEGKIYLVNSGNPIKINSAKQSYFEAARI